MRKTKFLMSLVTMFLFSGASLFAQSETEVTGDELKKFASALGEVQTVNQTAQQEMMTVVQSAGMEFNRFKELSEAQQNPNSQVEASSDEMKKFNMASQKVKQVQQKAQSEMQENIKKAGLTVPRYQEIATVVQRDPKLQKKLQELM